MIGLIVLSVAAAAVLIMLGVTVTQQFGVYHAGGALPTISSRPDFTGTIFPGAVVTLGAGTVTDQEIQLGFDVTTLKGVIITVEDNDATTVVLETNNSGAPIHTMTFPIGGGMVFWNEQFPAEILNPFKVLDTTDVTTIFVTKSGADTPTIRIQILK